MLRECFILGWIGLALWSGANRDTATLGQAPDQPGARDVTLRFSIDPLTVSGTCACKTSPTRERVHSGIQAQTPEIHLLAPRVGAECTTIKTRGGPSDGLPRAEPESVGMSSELLTQMRPIIERAIAEKKLPGCVVCVGRGGRIVWLEAYGQRQVPPDPAPMTTDTVFDLASLTKPIATATSVMKLVESGRVRLEDHVAEYLPQFAANGKDAITVRHLLRHESGLIADNPLADYADGPESAWQKICELSLLDPVGARFRYSDVNFIVLGQLVCETSGRPLDEFARTELFEPLGMRETGFLIDAALRARAAPTEQRDGKWMRGTVHDPRAYALGGVAGHAGLFSTAEDLAKFAQMLLGQGTLRLPGRLPVRVLSPRTVARMTRGERIAGAKDGLRGLGWDVSSAYSSNRGDLLSPSAFGHGGFTGTVLWIDPELDLFYIFLSNRVHPDGQGSVNGLAGRVANIIAGSVLLDRPRSKVLTGTDVLVRDQFRQLEGRRVGVITNQTGRAADGRSTVDLLHGAPDVELVAIFSPEHGFRGDQDASEIADSRDSATGVPIYSLYGQHRAPTEEMLNGIDTLVFDVQDIGTRFYTYISTMGLAMQAAAEHGKRFVVLDRPNPINGVDVGGPMLDGGRESFVGFRRMPVRHGMTVGELALFFREDLDLQLDLEIVRCEGWRRGDTWDETGLPWVNPSPNMRSITAALLYPGVGLLETTNVSVGRGTDRPFEWIGAPWLDARQLVERLQASGLAGVAFVPVEFTPTSSTHAGLRCRGVAFLVTDRARFDPLRLGWALAAALRDQHADEWEIGRYDRLVGNQAFCKALRDGASIDELDWIAQGQTAEFLNRRSTWLLYDP